ncbi:protein Skeletor, isoforms D/E isoform X1 [Drosophila sulfurigaster albostrigata]|uniref:protein Skeletor, isoforms D/E isoform X1 n=1 Tax=Drosophila sulfurigaster albostrigata TaxID=89887 RepID=UPI002D218C06|nr:protein Skeletor, isoforms D/E isoform X1 [Drosophila sulfurigaster albostrigata]
MLTTTKDKSSLLHVALLAALSSLQLHCHAAYPYYGTKIGALTRLHHGVSGDVYAVDSRTIFIKKFNYDGEAPAAYFYVGNTARPSNEGAARLRDEKGGTAALTRRYRNKDITLSLPEGKTLRDVKWFSVWCDEFAVNFGDVAIPNSLDFPRPQKISALRGVHGVSSDNIVIVDAQTLLVPNFSYDGEAPDAKFWVGRGQRPTSDGLRIPDENGKENPLRRYDRKTIVLTLPEDLTIFDIGHFGVWCEAFTVDFGHVRLPEGLNVPPSLKMLGISPQSKLNCEVLYDDLAFEVRWAVAGESIVVQLVAKLDPNNYMSFGISPNKNISQMIGADVAVAWVDPETGNGFAQDYYLEGKAQCSGGRGACPDVKILPNTNSIRLLNAAMVNGYSIVTYQRSLAATDSLDLPISVTDAESAVWAIGPLNDYREVSFHTYYNKHLHHIEFGRQPKWNCPLPEGAKSGINSAEQEDEVTQIPHSFAGGAGYPPAGRPLNVEPDEEFYENRAQALHRTTPVHAPQKQQVAALSTQHRSVPTPRPVNSKDAWDIPAIQCHEPEDGVFYAQMGPTGGKHGYPAITGHVGWGISWYINGLLIPELHVVRGRTYTFVVEGGNNPDIPAKYHPFYISDDPVGGYEHKREEEKKAVRIFAGVHRSRSGQVTPTGVGRLCNWTPDVEGPPADDYQSFGAYQRTLTLKCDAGEPGVISWKPDKNTPDTVYYHCFTHRYLGWKIHVHDSCNGISGGDGIGAASDRYETREPAPIREDYTAESSIRHETKVSPNDNFLLKHQTDLIKNHNMNGTPPKLSFEITKSSEITKLISDGIRAAEALEESLLRNQSIASEAAEPPTHNNDKSGTNNNGDISNNNVATRIPSIPLLAQTRPEILHGETQTHSLKSSSSQTSPSSLSVHPKLPIFAAPHSPSVIVNSHLHQRLKYPYMHHANFPLPHAYAHAHHHHHNTHLTIHHHNLTSNIPALAQKTISLSEYLRPPQNAPLFHPVKLPGRRPYPGPLKKVPASRPLPGPGSGTGTVPVLSQQHSPIGGILPQSSVIVNHYHKPVHGLLKPFLKEKHFPIQPIAASVLLLGQPTELNGKGQRIKEAIDRFNVKAKPIVPVPVAVPYVDLEPQGSHKSTSFFNVNGKVDQKPLLTMSNTTTITIPLIKHQIPDEPSPQQIASMRPAINQGFKPDSVVVESGFRPIVRNDGTGVQLPQELIEQVAHRREDPGTEIDEVMETDTLFLTTQQGGSESQSFEPIFIPSPLDSTNATRLTTSNMPQAVVDPVASASPLKLPSSALTHSLPSAAQLRKPSLEELFQENSDDEETLTDAADQMEDVLQATNPPFVVSKEQNSVELFDAHSDYDDLANLFATEEEENQQAHAQAQDSLADDNETETDDKIAQAAERIDTYYLPPDNRKIPHASIPSGAVYTFDGKSVVDSTLVLPPKLDAPDVSLSRHTDYGLTASEKLVRTTPQLGVYRGELPEDFLSTLQPVGQPVTDRTNDHRVAFGASSTSVLPGADSPYETQSPSSPPLTSSLRPISTKLHLLKPDINKNST